MSVDKKKKEWGYVEREVKGRWKRGGLKKRGVKCEINIVEVYIMMKSEHKQRIGKEQMMAF